MFLIILRPSFSTCTFHRVDFVRNHVLIGVIFEHPFLLVWEMCRMSSHVIPRRFVLPPLSSSGGTGIVYPARPVDLFFLPSSPSPVPPPPIRLSHQPNIHLPTYPPPIPPPQKKNTTNIPHSHFPLAPGRPKDPLGHDIDPLLVNRDIHILCNHPTTPLLNQKRGISSHTRT